MMKGIEENWMVRYELRMWVEYMTDSVCFLPELEV